MELQVGKSYRVKNDIFSFKAGEVWSLVDEGYQVYFGEHNFVFVNAEKNCHFMVLRDTSDEDMEIGCHWIGILKKLKSRISVIVNYEIITIFAPFNKKHTNR